MVEVTKPPKYPVNSIERIEVSDPGKEPAVEVCLLEETGVAEGQVRVPVSDR